MRRLVHTPVPARAGLTLTEVLMAMLVMGLGVISVFTLFPISIVRSIQATQGTNAKILEAEVTELMRSGPLVMNEHTPPPNPPPPAGPRFRGYWAPGRSYRVGDIIVPTIKPGSALPSPNVWYVCVETLDNMGTASSSSQSGLTEPDWDVTLNRPNFDRNNLNPNERITWGHLPLIQLRNSQIPYDDPLNPDLTVGAFYRTDRYVIDPLGWAMARIGGYGNAWEFGNDRVLPTTPDPVTNADPFRLLRINGGLNSQTLAELNTVLPDSWEQVLEDTPILVTDADPTGPTPGQVTFSQSIDLGGIGGFSRIVLTSLDGRVTAVRGITAVNPMAKTVSWSAREPLPARLSPSSIGFARIEIFDRRYTWFMTVKRNAANNADIKVVVVFKRGFGAEEEQVYDANFANPAIDLDMYMGDDGTQHGLTGRTDWVKITWDATPVTGDPTPLAKAGNYLFDARDVEWYRIRQVFDETTNGTTASRVLILDRSVVTPTPDDNMGMPPANAMPTGRVILMRGIVDIFDL